LALGLAVVGLYGYSSRSSHATIDEQLAMVSYKKEQTGDHSFSITTTKETASLSPVTIFYNTNIGTPFKRTQKEYDEAKLGNIEYNVIERAHFGPSHYTFGVKRLADGGI